jgi:hypothetical protein
MSTLAGNSEHDVLDVDDEPFEPSEYSLEAPETRDDGTRAVWKVEVRSVNHLIVRHVSSDGHPWDECTEKRWEPERVIWPAWPARPDSEAISAASPLVGLQDYWSSAGNRLRDSAKWMATVLGTALAAVVGVSPLTALGQHHLHGKALVLVVTGLGLLAVTLFLVLQVMRPQSVSFTEVQRATRGPWPWQRPLYKWQQTVDSQRDLYLPCGLRCLTGLRQSMIVEEITLVALARASATARDHEASQKLCDAQEARVARLLELRSAAARIATVGEYYKLRERSTWATYAGASFGLLGTIAIIMAFASSPT